ncbi:MAG: S8 family serine peptidase [Hyphomicrobium sp.]|nr:S8 family serine peptidase [Hyphomicrobium sp.]
MARGADLIPMQVFSRFSPAACGGSEPCVSAFFSDVIAAMERVIVLSRSHRIASVNLSLGGGQFTRACNTADATMRAMTRLIRNLSDRRIATVIASGNDGSNSFVNAPGCISTAVTVGSTTKADSVSGFSNHTRLVDLMAPGSDITAPILGSRFRRRQRDVDGHAACGRRLGADAERSRPRRWPRSRPR